jgi:hypothetical protein
MFHMIVASLAVVVTLAGVPAFAQETNSSSPPAQGGNSTPPQSTPVPPPQPQTQPQRDCEDEEAIS